MSDWSIFESDFGEPFYRWTQAVLRLPYAGPRLSLAAEVNSETNIPLYRIDWIDDDFCRSISFCSFSRYRVPQNRIYSWSFDSFKFVVDIHVRKLCAETLACDEVEFWGQGKGVKSGQGLSWPSPLWPSEFRPIENKKPLSVTNIEWSLPMIISTTGSSPDGLFLMAVGFSFWIISLFDPYK